MKTQFSEDCFPVCTIGGSEIWECTDSKRLVSIPASMATLARRGDKIKTTIPTASLTPNQCQKLIEERAEIVYCTTARGGKERRAYHRMSASELADWIRGYAESFGILVDDAIGVADRVCSRLAAWNP